MRPIIYLSRRSHIRAIWAITVVAIVAGGLLGYTFLTRDTSSIPQKIRVQLTFSPFVFTKATKDTFVSDYTFSTAENKVPILTYLIHQNDSTITVSQYTQPSEFTEIPEYKDRFLTNVAKQYSTVQTSNGTIFLGRLDRQNNKQLGILLERGLLVFMSPSKELEASAWRNIGDQLEIQKVVN